MTTQGPRVVTPKTISIVPAVALLACCVTAPLPETDSGARNHVLWVARHNGHSGLIVRSADVPRAAWPARRDFPRARFLETGWGDRAYYQREKGGSLLGLRALLWPTASALHVTAVPEDLELTFPGSEIIELRVTTAGFDRMVAFVADSYARDAAGNASVLGSGRLDDSLFYASDRSFHLFETCNTWVARALRAAGAPVDPRFTITAGRLMRQVRQVDSAAVLAPGT
ncbi:MAG: DUF2459 domain-containing protein [Gammaproteobacteria bacterium]